jgi:hypothetical protein
MVSVFVIVIKVLVALLVVALVLGLLATAAEGGAMEMLVALGAGLIAVLVVGVTPSGMWGGVNDERETDAGTRSSTEGSQACRQNTGTA